MLCYVMLWLCYVMLRQVNVLFKMAEIKKHYLLAVALVTLRMGRRITNRKNLLLFQLFFFANKGV